MTFSTIFLRRSPSLVAPLARRAIRDRGHSTLFESLLGKNNFSREICRRTSIFPSQFSSIVEKPSPDAELLTLMDSEIKLTEESVDHTRVDEIPDGFPFEIQDNPGNETVYLKREHRDEMIKVEIHMTDTITGEEDNDDDNNGDSNENLGNPSIPLVVTVLKASGTCLEFSCTAYADEVSIDGMSIRDPETSEDEINYERPNFTDLDENLQKAFHRYLEIRGIGPSITNFLHEYMNTKDTRDSAREYLMWLKRLKKFIAQ